ncbi:MAG: hypothetical protein WBE02_00925, partial [Bradyrhizobium sp.]
FVSYRGGHFYECQNPDTSRSKPPPCQKVKPFAVHAGHMKMWVVRHASRQRHPSTFLSVTGGPNHQAAVPAVAWERVRGYLPVRESVDST